MSRRRLVGEPAARPEKVEQAGIVRLLRSLGAKVYVLGTVRRRGDYPGTMQTPGLPDVRAFLKGQTPDTRVLLEIECKAAGGRLRPEQREYRACCQAAGIAHVVGGIDAVIAWLVTHGYLRADAVAAHYTKGRDHASPET